MRLKTVNAFWSLLLTSLNCPIWPFSWAVRRTTRMNVFHLSSVFVASNKTVWHHDIYDSLQLFKRWLKCFKTVVTDKALTIYEIQNDFKMKWGRLWVANCVQYCKDHSFTWFRIDSSTYDLFHISFHRWFIPHGNIRNHKSPAPNVSGFIHLIPKWQPRNYSFVCMLISPLRLVYMYRKQKNFEVKMRRRGLINMQTKE